MTPQASVVIVSRGRGPELARCLLSLEFQTCPRFEVIVVGDRAARQAVVAGPGLARVGFAPFEAANIAAARNAGVAAARAPVVAFLDDDAVAEPCWLAGLIAALQVPGVGLAAGYVRGPDGLAFQWRGEWLTPEGLSRPMTPVPEVPGHVFAQDGAVPGAMGTNFAVAAKALRAVGGFDARFRYFLDESDLVLRLAAAGQGVAYAPRAQVHHSLAPGPYRRADRLPRSLVAVGRSAALFAATHAPDAVADAVAAHRERQRTRLVRAMVAGRCLPDQVWSLLRSFDRGVAQANRVPVPPPETSFEKAGRLFSQDAAARSASAGAVEAVWLIAQGRGDPRAFAAAERAAEAGGVATVVIPAGRLSRPQVVFRAPGLWLHNLPLSKRQMTANRHVLDHLQAEYSDIRVGNHVRV
ncbi:glycosyltransferase [Dinoroseobacter sp. PD6]|uniref:glycosyltransferase family 2 protein n=1 Tax=Dinoroseobacter sp. PD6 TaxID=3028384 RepID=UPI00237BFC6B|nr:glycosyltransferase [Dinoroseobacter sp. PD6]MDD9717128.1 glycosyltransferase [Dinoroseobacter sp. PD6]